jgi:diaminopimelate decarboxylase
MNTRDKQWLAELAQENPTPFWVLLPRVSQSHFFELSDELQKAAKKVCICYSVKTNPHEKILLALNKMESGFECVSGRELHAVKSFSSPKIFNSCASSDEEIVEALSQGALIILDSLSHAEQVAKLSSTKPLSVGLRVRLDHHRFGFSPTEIRKTIEHLATLGLHVTVLHAHPGTNCTLNNYRNFISLFASIVKEYPFLQGVDIGGGLPGSVSLVERKEKLSSYVKLVREHLGEFLSTRTLYLESGRFLSEDTMTLVTRVQHLKSVDGQLFALLDAGINVLPRATMNPYRFFSLVESGKRKTSIRLAGPLMFGSDELGQIHAALATNDVIAVENVGAYCTEMSWNLSRAQPKIIVVE